MQLQKVLPFQSELVNTPLFTGVCGLPHVCCTVADSACVSGPATSQLVTLAAPPPLPADSLYYEVVEARVREGLHFRRGGQTVSFGDSPQV